MNIQQQAQLILWDTDSIFGNLQIEGIDVVYGAGGCQSHIVISPAPLCLDWFPMEVVDLPPVEPVTPPTTDVSEPSTLAIVLLGFGIISWLYKTNK